MGTGGQASMYSEDKGDKKKCKEFEENIYIFFYNLTLAIKILIMPLLYSIINY